MRYYFLSFFITAVQLTCSCEFGTCCCIVERQQYLLEAWKVLENQFGSGKSWKFELKVLESPGKWKSWIVDEFTVASKDVALNLQSVHTVVVGRRPLNIYFYHVQNVSVISVTALTSKMYFRTTRIWWNSSCLQGIWLPHIVIAWRAHHDDNNHHHHHYSACTMSVRSSTCYQ